MKNIAVFSFATIVLFSCQSAVDSSMEVSQSDPIELNEVAVIPNQVLAMEVDGMSCAMACGGAIRKGLKATNGVSSVQFDFEMGRETNIANISFDKGVISVEEMSALVAELNDGQFTVGNVSASDLSLNTSNKKESGEEATQIEISTPSFKMPNLLDLFSGLL